MRICKNLDCMGNTSYMLLSRGLLLSAAALAAGCFAIVAESWHTADVCRDISLSVLLLTTLLSCCAARRE